MKDDAIAQLSEQVMSLTDRIQEFERRQRLFDTYYANLPRVEALNLRHL
ncbi:MAG TPA: hypothetical protein VJ729_14610 [Nitrososphaeraceae archaeon]|nr:hypothetical protein [Nitrososphaeraceae archaeon]